MIKRELGSVCSRLSSGKSIRAENINPIGAYPVIGGNGLRGYTDSYNFDGECAVIGRQGAACGNVRYHSGKAYMTEHAVVVCANDENDTRYLSYLLSIQNLGRLSAQSAQPGISVKTLSKQEVCLPPLDEQKRVSQLLGTIDSKINANTKLNDYLAELLEVQYCYALRQGTERRLLVDVVNVLSGGTPSTKVSDYWENGTIPFFTPGDATNSVYTLVTEKHITEVGLSNCNSALYPEETVFLSARGTVGKVAMAGVPMAMNQSCFAFSGIDVPQTIVFQVIKRAVYSLKAKAIGAVFSAINTRDLKLEEVEIPAVSAMTNFNAVATPIHKLIRKNEEENIRLASLRDALLPQLMSGEVDVSKVDFTQQNNHLCDH